MSIPFILSIIISSVFLSKKKLFLRKKVVLNKNIEPDIVIQVDPHNLKTMYTEWNGTKSIWLGHLPLCIT